jgi:hypothetical protein
MRRALVRADGRETLRISLSGLDAATDNVEYGEERLAVAEQLREQAIRAIVTQDPRRAGERALGLAMQHCQAEAGALFKVDNDELSLFVGRSIDQLTLDRSMGVWRTQRDALRLGQLHLEHQFLVAPIGPTDTLSGLLYLAARGGLSAEGTAETVRALSGLIEIALASESDEPSEEPSAETAFDAESGRARLLRLLESNEWNIARVARVAGVSRVTIYSWLKRYEIERKLVPRGPGRLSLPGL